MIFNQKVAALVPMKEHSERVPGKNTKAFAGKPLFHHILATLEATYTIDTIVVNTDSERIAEEARATYPKVQVIDRPENLRGDFVSMNKLIAHDIAQVAAEIYVQTHATNPLLRSKTISNALRDFAKTEEYDSLFTVNRVQTRLYDSEGQPVNHDPEELMRTQDLPPLFEENSCLYIFSPESFKRNNRRIGDHPLMYETDPIESIDIDDEFTFRLAEMLAGYAHR
jgi:CMP-N-acetylneuraminic acid synthetase